MKQRYNNARKKIAVLCQSLSLAAAFGAPLVQAADLADIYNVAASQDPVVREARERFNASHTLVDQGRSQLLPTVSFSLNTSRETTGIEYPDPDEPTDVPHSIENGFNSRSYSVNLNQNLLNFEAWYAFQSALESDRAAAATLAQAEQELILRVATAYFDVLRSLDNLEAFEAEEEASRQVLEQTSERFEVGLVPITDVYDSQANFDLARVNRLVEENNLNQRFEALEAITGRSFRDLETLDEDFPIESPSPDNIEAWVALAEENNLAIQAAEYDFEASVEDAKAARAAMYPTVAITAGYNWRESRNPFSFFASGIPNEGTSIGFNVSMPIFAGGLNNARKRQAYFTRNATEEVLIQTQRESVRLARNSFRSAETNALAVQARQQAIISAQSALEATEVGAEVGTRNVVDVVLAQRTLFQAIRDYSNARYDYVMDTLNLKQAAGILSPQDVYDLNQWLEQQ